MSIINSFLDFLMQKLPENLSDEEKKNMILNSADSNLEPYIKYHSNIEKESLQNPKIKKLILMRLFSDEIWNVIVKNDFSHKKEFGRRINVIGNTYHRMLVNTDENICLFRKKYGLSIISNLRMMLECLAIAKYIWDAGEDGAIRFQDYATKIGAKISGKNPKEILKNKYTGDKLFSKPNGWILDKKFRNLHDLIKNLHNKNYNNLYKFSCEYVHASPYSVQKLSELNQELEVNPDAYFPLGFDNEINLNIYLIYDYTEFVINHFMPDTEEKEAYGILANLIAS